ncbi:methyltransferase, TIGR04325 family [Candidatus Bipolaricaulota bacterium]
MRTQQAEWPQFLRSANRTDPLGVAHEALVPSNRGYSAHNTIMAYGYVLALAARKKDRISLLDWGGGIGHYYILSRALLPEVEIDYHCKDVPLLCQGGRELFPEARFYNDARTCFERTYDLVLASSSLQYSEDWPGTVTQLASVSRSYLYVTRLPIVRRAASFVVIQRPYQYGYKTEYLSWVLNRQEFLNYMDSLGMTLVREFQIQERPFVHRAPEQGESRGFLFRPRGGGSKA